MNDPPNASRTEPTSDDWLDCLLEDFLGDTAPRRLDEAALRAATEIAEFDHDYASRLDAAAIAAAGAHTIVAEPATVIGLAAHSASRLAAPTAGSRSWRARIAVGAAAAATIAAGLSAAVHWASQGSVEPLADLRSPRDRQKVEVAAADAQVQPPVQRQDEVPEAVSNGSADALAAATGNRDSQRSFTEPLFSPDSQASLAPPSVAVDAGGASARREASRWYAAASQLRDTIDSQFEQLWKRLQLPHDDAIDAGQWADRTYFRLTGSPLPDETREQFSRRVSDEGEAAKLWLLSGLLESNAFVDVWSRRLAEEHFDLAAVNAASHRRRAYDDAVAAIAAAIRADEPIAKLWERFLTLPVEHAEALVEGGEVVAIADQPARGTWWINHSATPAAARGQQLLRQWLGPQAACVNCHEVNPGGASLADAGSGEPMAWPMAATLNKFELTAGTNNPKMRLLPERELYFEQTDGRIRLATVGHVVPGIDRGVFSVRSADPTPEAIIDAWQSWAVFARTSPRVGGQYIDVVWRGLFASPLVDPLSGPPGGKDAAYEELLDLRSFLASDSQLGGRSLRQLVEALVLSEVFARPELVVGDITGRQYPALLASFAAHRQSINAEFRSTTAAVAWLRRSGLADDSPAEALAQPAYTRSASGTPPTAVGRDAVDPTGRGWFALADAPPETWKHWIKKLSDSELDWPSVVDHSYYLLVGREANPQEQSAAQELLEVSGSRERTLARLFASLAGV